MNLPEKRDERRTAAENAVYKMTDEQVQMMLNAVRDTAETLNGEGYHTAMHAPTQAALDIRFLLAHFDRPSNTENSKHDSKLSGALRGLMKLLDDGDLVRNIENDNNPVVFMRQSLKIVKAISVANKALEQQNKVENKPCVP